MEKQIFKVGDKVYCALYGKGIVVKVNPSKMYSIEVKFENKKISTYTNDGRIYDGYSPTLSLTPYTLEGFSQERPVDYNDYIGKLGLFWDNEKHNSNVGKLSSFDFNRSYIFVNNNHDIRFKNFQPLTKKQIKVLGLNKTK